MSKVGVRRAAGFIGRRCCLRAPSDCCLKRRDNSVTRSTDGCKSYMPMSSGSGVVAREEVGEMPSSMRSVS